jgi:Domain of unknown function (DUF1992)
MSERKPEGMEFESFVEQQIRRAQAEGAFRDLPGAGRPIPEVDKPLDELWWLKAKLKREGLDLLPEALAVRRDVERALARARTLRSEREVRALLLVLNRRIQRLNATATGGPPTSLAAVDVEEAVREWRASRRR